MSNIYTSVFSGYNYYEPIENNIEELLHCQSKEKFNVVYKVLPDFPEHEWYKYISNPPLTFRVRWPIDIIKTQKENEYGLVLKNIIPPKYEKLKNLVYDSYELDHRKESIRELTINIIDTLILLEKSGYIYNTYDSEKIYFHPQTYDLIFDFSTSIIRNDCNTVFFSFLYNDVSSDFMPPWVNIDESNKNYMTNLNINSSNYSLAALLFRLMIGRLPYQGRLSDGIGDLMVDDRDNEPLIHKEMVKLYLKHPIFIFDKKNKINAIGDFGEEKKYIERWESLPFEVKKIFESVFISDNNENCSSSVITPNDWKKVLYK